MGGCFFPPSSSDTKEIHRRKSASLQHRPAVPSPCFPFCAYALGFLCVCVFVAPILTCLVRGRLSRLGKKGHILFAVFETTYVIFRCSTSNFTDFFETVTKSTEKKKWTFTTESSLHRARALASSLGWFVRYQQPFGPAARVRFGFAGNVFDVRAVAQCAGIGTDLHLLP